MTTRRDFLKGAAAAVIATGISSKANASTATFPGVIYTSDSPGKWAKKVGSHAPVVSVESRKVTITTKHPMSEAHFIVRHTLVLEDGTVVGASTFTPADKPESTYELPAGYTSKFYATSFCNLHDFWLTEHTPLPSPQNLNLQMK